MCTQRKPGDPSAGKGICRYRKVYILLPISIRLPIITFPCWLSYPNYSDRIKGHKETPGGDIYIHGGCVTIGCLPMQDEVIKENLCDVPAGKI
ncbi:MAG: hypothetical protein KL787_05985 [Taibaiella sp.]|nr:hypothetical protein [Taibaiella sp.]